MSSVDTIKRKYKQHVEEQIIKFEDVEEIKFPKVCVICGVTTDNQFKQRFYGSFLSYKDYKKDYTCSLPICIECSTRVRMKTGISSKSGQLVLISSIIGLISAIIIYNLTYSIIFSISIFTVSFILPFLNYIKKMRKKIKLKEFLEIKLSSDNETLVFNFVNPIYAKFVRENNTKEDVPESIQNERELIDSTSETNLEETESDKNEE